MRYIAFVHSYFIEYLHAENSICKTVYLLCYETQNGSDGY